VASNNSSGLLEAVRPSCHSLLPDTFLPTLKSDGKSLRSLFLHTGAAFRPVLGPAPKAIRHLCHFCIKLPTCLQREAPPVTGIRRALRKHMGVSVFRTTLRNRPSYVSHSFRLCFRSPPRINLFPRLTYCRKAHGSLADLEQKTGKFLTRPSTSRSAAEIQQHTYHTCDSRRDFMTLT